MGRVLILMGRRYKCLKSDRFATGAQTMHRMRPSETLCRKGGTSRSDNAPHASGARVGAKLACGATLSATRDFEWDTLLNKHVYEL